MAARFVPLLRIWLRRSSSFGAARVVSPPALVAPLWRTLSLRTRASKHRGGGIHSLPSLSPHHRSEPQHDRAAPASLLSKPSSSSSSRSLSSVHRNRPAARLPLPRVCILNQRSFFLPCTKPRQTVRTQTRSVSFCLQLPGALPAAALLRGCRPCARAVEGARTVLSCSPHSSLQMASSFCFSFLQTASAGRPAAPRLALRTAGTSAWRRRGRGAHRWPPAWRSPASPARCSSTCCSASSRRPCRRRAKRC